MKTILLATVAALGLAGTASAADLSVKAPVVYAPLFTWTGCYLGVNGGWIGSDESYDTDLRHHPPVRGPWINQGGRRADFDRYRRSFSSDESGGTVGGQFGCQWQWGSVVLGGEWDWAWSGLEEEDNVRFGPIAGPNIGLPERAEHHHKQLDWFMTVRARLGWAAWDRFLIYATGGVAMGAYDAFTRVNLGPFDQFDPFDAAPEFNGSYREKRIGWTAGGGFEWAFANNWTAKAEFLYLDFGSFDYHSPHIDFGVDDTRVWWTEVDAQEYVVRVGLNYLFHLGDAPVVARY